MWLFCARKNDSANSSNIVSERSNNIDKQVDKIIAEENKRIDILDTYLKSKRHFLGFQPRSLQKQTQEEINIRYNQIRIICDKKHEDYNEPERPTATESINILRQMNIDTRKGELKKKIQSSKKPYISSINMRSINQCLGFKHS